MSGWKKRFTAAALCISVQFLSSGSFAKVFAGAMAIPALLKASAQAQRSGVQLCAAEMSDDNFVLASQNEAAKKSLGAKESVTTPFPSGVVHKFFLEILITPKVSRHIAKSVLIL